MPSAADSAFLLACRREPVPHTPVWFMRQAGRSLPEYRAAREGVGMLESCLRPDLVAEITMQPVRRYGVDAAILFSDIVLPLKAAGLDLDIVGGIGPVIAEPVRRAADVERIPRLEPGDVGAVTEAVGGLVDTLGGTPLIGFAGAPFTLRAHRRDLPLLAAVGAGDVGANAMFAVASTHGLLSIVAVLSSLYPAVTVLLARMVHAERMNAAQNIGVVATLGGVALIAAG